MSSWFVPVVFVSVCLSASAQRVDWLHAPLNPQVVPVTTEGFQLKGPVYSADKRVFAEDGRLLKEISHVRYEDGQLVGKGSIGWQTDTQGLIVRQTYDNGRDSRFFYEDGRLVREESSFKDVPRVTTYGYDAVGRLTQETRTEGDSQETITYTYTTDGDDLKVVKTEQRGNGPVQRSFLTYRAGYLVYSAREGDPLELRIEREWDAYGNPVKERHIQNNGIEDTFIRVYHYYPDIRQRNEITFGSVLPDQTYPVSVFRNGQIAADITWENRADKSGVVIYDDFDQTYYLADPIPATPTGERLKGRAIAAGTEVICFFDGKMVEPYFRGSPVFRGSQNRLQRLASGDLITYSEDQVLPTRTSLLIRVEPGQAVFRGRVLAQTHKRFATHLFTAFYETGELELFRNGERAGYTDDFEYGILHDDIVLIAQGQPTYVIPQGRTVPLPGVFPVRTFSPEQDGAYTRLRPKADLTTPAVAKEAPRDYQAAKPVTIRRTTQGAQMFLQDGLPIGGPAAFVQEPRGDGFAFYPPAYYHLFAGLDTLPMGEERAESRTVADKWLVMDGTTGLHVWNRGQRVREVDRQLFQADSGSRLLCVPAEDAYLLLPPVKGGVSYPEVTMPGSFNFLIVNRDGLVCVERGLPLEGEEVTLHALDGGWVVYIGSDPVYQITDAHTAPSLAPGIYALSDYP